MNPPSPSRPLRASALAAVALLGMPVLAPPPAVAQAPPAGSAATAPARTEVTSQRLGLLQSRAPTMGEDEMLDYLRGVRADCGASSPVHRGIVVADLRERLLRRRVTSAEPAAFGTVERVGAGAVARQVAEFEACSQEVPFPPGWESPRSGGRWLGEELGVDLDAPFSRLTAWRKRGDDVVRYSLATSEASLREFLATMAPGTPIELEFIVSSAVDDEVRGVLLRVARVGDPPPGEWTPPLAGAWAARAAAAAKAKPSYPSTLRLPDPKPAARPAVDTAIKLNETFVLGVGDAAHLGKSPIAIRLKDVVSKNDCPDRSSPDCRLGPADIHLEVTANTGRSAVLTFESPMMTPVEIPMGGFRLRMLRISPRPDLVAGDLDKERFRAEFVLDLGRPKPPPKPERPTSTWTRGVDDLYWWWLLIEGLMSEDW